MHVTVPGKPACPSPRRLIVAFSAVFMAVAGCSGKSVIGELAPAGPGSAGAHGSAAGAGGAVTGSAGSGGSGSGGSASGGYSGSAGGGNAGGAGGENAGGAGGGSGGSAGAGGSVAGSGGGVATDLVRSDYRSCSGFQGNECQGGNCCDSILLPGGRVTVGGTEWKVPSFRLDKYEVTVARFRSFMNAVDAWAAAGNPMPGAGAHPFEANSGWRADWATSVDQYPLKALVADGLKPTWRNYPTAWGSSPDRIVQDGNPDYVIPGTDGLAVNWVPFHIAFAFCIWDGGRLPAKLEFLVALQGGDGTAAHPWGNTPPPKDVFAVRPPPSVPTTYNDPVWQYLAIPVGSHPASVGLFGHHDLAAGLDEYVRDAARAGGAASTGGGLIELGGDEVVAGDPKDPSSPLPLIGRLSAEGDWRAPRLVDTFSSIDGLGGGTVGFRCARRP